MEAEAKTARELYVTKFPTVRARMADLGNISRELAGKPENLSKVVLFIRHGQGFHNLLGEVAKGFGASFSDDGDHALAVSERCPYIHPGVQDPPLTHLGREDAKALRALLRGTPVELAVCSPLRRATQTVLVGLSELQQSSPVPVIVHSSCREQHGVYVSDKLSDVEDLKAEFCGVDYSLMQPGEDLIWQPTVRESMLDMAHRVEDFLEWLKHRPESVVVVGTHSAWLFSAFNVVLEVDDNEASALQKGFSTGEMRPVLLSYSSI